MTFVSSHNQVTHNTNYISSDLYLWVSSTQLGPISVSTSSSHLYEAASETLLCRFIFSSPIHKLDFNHKIGWWYGSIIKAKKLLFHWNSSKINRIFSHLMSKISSSKKGWLQKVHRCRVTIALYLVLLGCKKLITRHSCTQFQDTFKIVGNNKPFKNDNFNHFTWDLSI